MFEILVEYSFQHFIKYFGLILKFSSKGCHKKTEEKCWLTRWSAWKNCKNTSIFGFWKFHNTL